MNNQKIIKDQINSILTINTKVSSDTIQELYRLYYQLDKKTKSLYQKIRKFEETHHFYL